MFIDARTVATNTLIDYEICVVGSGAAGITLARELAGEDFRVCLLESGGLEEDPLTQSLSDGENVGRRYDLGAERLRFFGGTTNHWGGWCRPFDEIDFEPRDWVPWSGWPFTKSHLIPFYERAQRVCELGRFSYDVESWETPDAPRLPFVGDRVVHRIFQIGPPTRFGVAYRDEIFRAPNIDTYLFANVVEIETAENARAATRVRVATLAGNEFAIAARLFVLAAGGIENARLLLLSKHSRASGLGNENDLVGRFFMQHQEVITSEFQLADEEFSTALFDLQRYPVVAVLTLSPDTQRRERLLNFTCEVQPAVPDPSTGLESFRYLRREVGEADVPDDFWRHLMNVAADIDDVARAAHRRFAPPGPVLQLSNASETVPNPDSRVTLSSERDRLGKNCVRLDWRLSAIDRTSVRRACEILGQEIGGAGLGRLKVLLDDEDDWRFWGQAHHMGTTRMHADSRRGVVDENCRVHGVSNLYIAGSSVFPTSSSATPTYTIVALALRLADHLKGLIR